MDSVTTEFVSVLKNQVEFLTQQLKSRDEQIQVLSRQLKVQEIQNTAKDEQISQLTNSLSSVLYYHFANKEEGPTEASRTEEKTFTEELSSNDELQEQQSGPSLGSLRTSGTHKTKPLSIPILPIASTQFPKGLPPPSSTPTLSPRLRSLDKKLEALSENFESLEKMLWCILSGPSMPPTLQNLNSPPTPTPAYTPRPPTQQLQPAIQAPNYVNGKNSKKFVKKVFSSSHY